MRRLSTSPATQRGVTLTELLVSLTIGAFLMAGAVTVYVQSKSTYTVNESVSRLQENARFALSALKQDLLMANYWGDTADASLVSGWAGPGEPVPAGLAVGGDCGVNWSIDLGQGVSGSNNGYDWACSPYSGGTVSDRADALVLRRASAETVAPAAGRIQLQSTLVQARLFSDGALPAGFTAGGSITNDLVVHGYYVSGSSSVGPDVPSLRRKRLAAGPRIIDEEVAPGVEDFQVQLGVDTDAAGSAGRGTVNRWVNADDPILNPASPAYIAGAQVTAVRVWLLMRAEAQETGFTNTRSYSYADQNRPAAGDGYRRLLVSDTIFLRNTTS